MKDHILIKGAREHNLKNIDARIPKNKLVVFTGVSGSGKTSLAMDTLYAEGQRRYVESLSSYARQFLGMMHRPDVDAIEGLSPAIAIDQRALSHNPRSTVGTITEIYDYLRLLFAKIGHPHCPQCGQEVSRQTSQSITEQIINLSIKQLNNRTIKQFRFMILSPVVRDKRGEFTKLFGNLTNKGFEQARIDGRIYGLDEDLILIKTNRHNIDVVVDRISANKKQLKTKEFFQRIKDDVEIALDLADGLVILTKVQDKGFTLPEKPTQMKDILFSQRFACPVCNLSMPEIEPRLFSFNSPFGACPQCNGLGVKLKIDTTRVSPWRAESLERRYYTTTSDVVREEIEKLMIKETCFLCSGTRLKKESLAVTINGYSIAQLAAMSLAQLQPWLKNLANKPRSLFEKQVAAPIISQINSRLAFLNAVGIGYLTLDRQASSLAVGEGQRIRLANQIGSGLTGVLYILDEPTVGLHPRDINRLIETLKRLRDLGNTVIVVEHDPSVIENADWVVDFGPGAGREGGKMVAQGSPKDIKKNRHSLTGQYLSGKKKIPYFPNSPNYSSKNTSEVARQRPPCPPAASPPGDGRRGLLRGGKKGTHWLTITNCQTHNLKNINFQIPLEKLVCLTGISGSGKSSLLIDTLYPALKRVFNPEFKERGGKFEKLQGTDYLGRVLLVDQSPIGRTSRSNPATYIGVFTDIRQLFAQTREARLRGFTQTHFSFNTEGGRCEVCRGQGQLRVQMQFLADVWINCEECQGTRYKNETLQVEFKQKNIAQVLKLTINEALNFFAAIPSIVHKLQLMKAIGLGYLELGRPSPTLSGGESQRLKITRELVKKSQGETLYLLDEPTTGLHFADLENLLRVLKQLVSRGNTVVVIEHNLEIVKQADWIVDLGPEGGENGGYIVAEGIPEEIMKNGRSWTGKYLKKSLKH